ncbi:hypothetical protein CAURIC_09560 [Corynebacterium auriscanis]|nr:hypothetical protein CAURIC_09560 [Corynebacterium auriscanis]
MNVQQESDRGPRNECAAEVQQKRANLSEFCCTLAQLCWGGAVGRGSWVAQLGDARWSGWAAG